MNVLVIAAHPDDEVIGMGATIKKLSEKNLVHLCVVSEGASAQYENKKMIQIRKKACKKSSEILGISKIEFMNFPDMRLDSVPQLEINRSLEKIISEFKPEIIFTTPPNDLNKDHKITYESTIIAARPVSSDVKEILSYELPGFTNKPFEPNTYVDISKQLGSKINAFKEYESEIKEFPHPRSFKAIENLSIQRGIESGLKNAEAFTLVKKIYSKKDKFYF